MLRPSLRPAALGLLLAGTGLGAVLAARAPSHDRAWALEQSRLPRITLSDTLVRIEDFRRFRLDDSGRVAPGWEDRTYDLRRLRSAWLVLAPFSRAWRGPAHLFASFGFDDSTFVAVSVEARRETGEEYGILRGLGRTLELMYVLGDEADLIGRRAAAPDADLYLYPITTTPERVRAVFLDILRRAETLRSRPEFYHTVWNNCTSNLVDHVNAATPGRIRAGLRLLLPGYADDVARRLGLIDSTLPIDAARRRYRITDRARAHLGAPDFSLRIRS